MIGLLLQVEIIKIFLDGSKNRLYLRMKLQGWLRRNSPPFSFRGADWREFR